MSFLQRTDDLRLHTEFRLSVGDGDAATYDAEVMYNFKSLNPILGSLREIQMTVNHSFSADDLHRIVDQLNDFELEEVLTIDYYYTACITLLLFYLYG